MKRILLLLTLIITTLTTLAEVRYVSKTGTSTPPYLTWETACDSIQKCINICNDGDTIYVANGVYRDTLDIDKILWLIGNSMDSTVIDGTDLAVSTIEVWHHGLGGSIENFKILGKGYGSGGAGILTTRTVRIKNCRILNDGAGISLINEASYIENVIISNVDYGVDGGCSTGGCSNYLKNSLILIEQRQGTGVWTGLNGTYYLSENIILYKNTHNGGDGIFVNHDRQAYIYNNIVSGFITNIFVSDPLDTVFIINNVLGNEPEVAGGSACILSGGQDLSINNVIFANNHTAIGGDQYVKPDYNLFWNNDINYRDVIPGDSDIVADPMFVKDTTKPDTSFNFDFHLQAFSPAIDKGNPNILDKDGTRSDIGVYGGPYGETYIYRDLAPREPRGITISQDTGYAKIQWRKNTEADIGKYRIYRDTTDSFYATDTTKLIGTTEDTVYTDILPGRSTRTYYYKLTAMDRQGHESRGSDNVEIITDVKDNPQRTLSYNLYQNYPNPFNPTTKIGYQLKEKGYVKVMIYNIAGKLVKTVVNGNEEAGYHEAEFTATNLSSGIYLYRIEIIGGEDRIPKYTEMKKMVLIK